MKPDDIPTSMLFRLNENCIPSAPALANTELNPRDTKYARTKPNRPPKVEATEEVITPSITASERISDFLRPIALIIASSTLRDSASIITIVTTSRIPAAIVNAPNTRNIADSAPAPSSAASKAVSFAGFIRNSIESVVETEFSQAYSSGSLAFVKTRILRSPSSEAARISPSVRLTNPIIIDSNSSIPGALNCVMFPTISKVSGRSSPYAQGTKPLSNTFSL